MIRTGSISLTNQNDGVIPLKIQRREGRHTRVLFIANMDPTLLQSYQFGVVLGLIILSTLILFPGRNQNDFGNSLSSDTTTATPVLKDHLTSSTSKATATERIPGNIDASSYSDSDPPTLLSPHRRLNWMVYLCIYIVMIVILFYSYHNNNSGIDSTTNNHDTLPLYRRQLQNPTKLLQLTLEAYFPKEASLLFSAPSRTSPSKATKRRNKQ